MSLACLFQAEYHLAEAEYYVPSDAVADLPGGMTPMELVASRDGGNGCLADGSLLPSQSPLFDAASEFFYGCQQVLVVVGDPGMGKTVFTWKQAELCARNGWVPVVLDLKEYKTSQLAGALPQYLQQRCGVSERTVGCLARGVTPPGLHEPVKLAVFCDGYDELQIGEKSRETLCDFAGTLCGAPGAAWPTTVLRVVVTTRGNALRSSHDEAAVFSSGETKYMRRVVLPFSDAQVSVRDDARMGFDGDHCLS